MLKQCLSRFYRLDRSGIGFLKFMIEACDGIAIITTVDALKGIIRLQIAPGCETDVDQIIAGLEEEFMIEKS